MKARQFESKHRRAGMAAAALVPVLSGAAAACGSMAFRAVSPAQIWTAVTATLLLPMAALIPAELAIIKRMGKLNSQRAIDVYLHTLPAKICGLALVALAAKYKLISGILIAEAIYSIVHFSVALLILKKTYGNEIYDPTSTAFMTSTAIPWAYSLAMPFCGLLAVMFISK